MKGSQTSRIFRRNMIIADELTLPIDEGYKKFTYNLFKYCLANISEIKILSSPSNLNISNIGIFQKSRTFLNSFLIAEIKKYNPDKIIYIPSASTSFYSFLRYRILQFIAPNSNIVMISIQKRRHNLLSKYFIQKGLYNIITFSKSANDIYSRLGVHTKYLPLGVDTQLFNIGDPSIKKILRNKYGLNISDRIVLHVGHINKKRNLQILTCLISLGFKVVVIGSTSTHQDIELYKILCDAGIKIYDKYIENIQELYQLSDYYIFPVIREDAAIEFPLSIMEAMSCNLPILSTKFGGLVDYFPETDYFKYFNTEDELISKIKNIGNIERCTNRGLIESTFKWEYIYKNIVL